MTIKVGDIAKFRGYASDPGDSPALNPGDTVKIVKAAEDGGWQVCRVDAEGNATDLDDNNNVIGEILFPEEIEELPTEAAAEVAPAQAAATDAAPAAKAKGGKKAKAEKAAKEPAKATAEAKPAKVAKKAKTEKAPATGTSPTQVAASIKPVAGATVFQHSALVQDVLASVAGTDGSEQHAALIAAKTLVNRVDETYYTLGGVLHYIKEQGIYKAIGYDGKRGFADYVKAEIDVDYRKAQDLILVYETVQRAGLNEARLSEIGWSKARQIVRIGANSEAGMNALRSDFDSLIDLAKEQTRDDLISTIKSKYETVTSRESVKVKKTHFSFYLVAETAASVEAGISEAKQLAGTEDEAEAFAYIVNDWRMMQSGNTMTPEQQVAALAERLGLQLEIKGQTTGSEQVVHAE